MSWAAILGWCEVGLLWGLALLVALTPWRKGERRAARRAMLLFFPWPVSFTLTFLLVPSLREELSLAIAAAGLILLALLLVPGQRPEGIRIRGHPPGGKEGGKRGGEVGHGGGQVLFRVEKIRHPLRPLPADLSLEPPLSPPGAPVALGGTPLSGARRLFLAWDHLVSGRRIPVPSQSPGLPQPSW